MRRPLIRKNGTRESLVAYSFLLPSFAGIVVFCLIPITMTLINSFYNYGFYQAKVFTGLGNYIQVLKDKNFLNSIFVGVKFALIVVPAQMVCSFLFANVVKNLRGRFAGFVKTSIFVPTVISGVIASLIFMYVYDYQAGILNTLLKLFHIPRQAWFQDKNLALFSIAVPRIWLGFGYSTLLMLGALLDIPEVYYEAAKIDGAGAFRRMLNITIPSMKNISLFMLVSSFVAAMQEFDLPYNMTGGGPARSTETPTLFVYNHFSQDTTIGFSISAALMITVVLGFISAVIFRAVNSEKSFE